ncbi:BTB/POZ domain-containing protein KCTD6-like [Anneissia japonica]|uniref:BTB/POZ domain-containing protein KCTD6-like n=1 Tax=Anneissia japonica TaxID=1529436 RepID=UPI00142570B5|nr:BTB/POZ domain-containing protein KCTD6-like [Anneissia japonica]
MADEILNLNVGGCIYTTSRSTLTRYPDSMLGSMFSGRLQWPAVDDCHRYIIDGDGPTFRHILNFLRRSKLILPDGFQEWDILSAEADYYQIQELIQLIDVKRIRRPGGPTYEFVEVEFQRGSGKYQWRIFGKPNIIHQILTDNDYFICVATLEEYTTQSPSQDVIGRAECTGYTLIPCDTPRNNTPMPQHSDPHLSRVRLFRGITKFGFTLISTSSLAHTHKWTFSRKEVADD